MGSGRGTGLDLRFDPRLHHHQRRLPELAPGGRHAHPVLVSAVALLDADNRVLLAQRPDGKVHGRSVGVPRRGKVEQR